MHQPWRTFAAIINRFLSGKTTEMTNLKMRKSHAYKTYLAYATGAIPPKKARKFKKPASLSKKKTLVAVEEPAKKPPRNLLLEDNQLVVFKSKTLLVCLGQRRRHQQRLKEDSQLVFELLSKAALLEEDPSLYYDPWGQLKSGSLQPIKNEMLFQPMFDEHLEQSRVNEPVPSATEINAQVVPPGTSLSTTIAQDAPSTSASSSTSDMHHPSQYQKLRRTHSRSHPNHQDILHLHINSNLGDPRLGRINIGNVIQQNHPS
ncbi:hypothetical protein Tco_1114208 [Tanacetum coccineum]|uniref:Uncharacterized protein n=1 Tax=Tanacetum coccineum TaxID=301880 RepID=A0ABQ5IUF4_9ASTR